MMANDRLRREDMPAARERRCLKCGGPFPSDGPHNRVCKRCKGNQEWREGRVATWFDVPSR